MPRKHILAVALVILAAFLLSTILVGTMPFWFTAYMINPRLLIPVHDYLVQGFMREASKAIFRGVRTPTQPIQTMGD